MKRKIYMIGLWSVLLCCGCSDWLTIQPETSVTAETLFKTDVGVTQGLNGAYYIGKDVYGPVGRFGGGGNYTFVEVLANTYLVFAGSSNYLYANHLWEQMNTQDEVNVEIFRLPYNVIANLNSLINEMVKNQDGITPSVYNIVRGEALAYRACCHLDLLRLYGPVPSAADVSKTYLPYVRINDVDNYEYHTFNQYMDYLQADLDSAEMFLAKSDPVLSVSFETTNSTSITWPYRKSRMNYYGVLALQARAALWRGDKDKALRYARLVKEALNEDGTSKFTFTTFDDDVSDYTRTDLSHYSEHICGKKNETYDALSISSPWRGESLYNTEAYLKELYGEDYATDLRYVHFWKTNGGWSWDADKGEYVWVATSITIHRYDDFRPSLSSPHNFPIVRLPEMYFIIMECGTLAEANSVYEEYCRARGIDYVPLAESNRQERIMLESIREYAGEGQNFFTYKRNNVRRMVGATTDCSEEQYIVPIPDKEFNDVK